MEWIIEFTVDRYEDKIVIKTGRRRHKEVLTIDTVSNVMTISNEYRGIISLNDEVTRQLTSNEVTKITRLIR